MVAVRENAHEKKKHEKWIHRYHAVRQQTCQPKKPNIGDVSAWINTNHDGEYRKERKVPPQAPQG